MKRNPLLGADQVVCPCGHGYVASYGIMTYADHTCPCGAVCTLGYGHSPDLCWIEPGEHDGPTCDAFNDFYVEVKVGSAHSARLQRHRPELGLEAWQ